MNLVKDVGFKKAASAVSEELARVVRKKGSAVLAVSGGKSPLPFFRELDALSVAWERVVVELVDERVVSEGEAGSNTTFVKANLPRARFLSILNLGRVEAFANEVFLQPDVVVLGMGLDGHTASIFPCCDELEFALTTKQKMVLTRPKTAPFERISMSMSAILQSESVFLLIDEVKAGLLETCVEKRLPVSYVLERAKVFVS